MIKVLGIEDEVVKNTYNLNGLLSCYMDWNVWEIKKDLLKDESKNEFEPQNSYGGLDSFGELTEIVSGDDEGEIENFHISYIAKYLTKDQYTFVENYRDFGKHGIVNYGQALYMFHKRIGYKYEQGLWKVTVNDDGTVIYERTGDENAEDNIGFSSPLFPVSKLYKDREVKVFFVETPYIRSKMMSQKLKNNLGENGGVDGFIHDNETVLIGDKYVGINNFSSFVIKT